MTINIKSRFDFNNPVPVEGEEPKPKTPWEGFLLWVGKNPFTFLGYGLLACVVYWYFGEHWIFGGIADQLQPPRHLNIRIR